MFCWRKEGSFTGRSYSVKSKTKLIPYIRVVGHTKGPNLHHFLSRTYTTVYMLTCMIVYVWISVTAHHFHLNFKPLALERIYFSL